MKNGRFPKVRQHYPSVSCHCSPEVQKETPHTNPLLATPVVPELHIHQFMYSSEMTIVLLFNQKHDLLLNQTKGFDTWTSPSWREVCFLNNRPSNQWTFGPMGHFSDYWDVGIIGCQKQWAVFRPSSRQKSVKWQCCYCLYIFFTTLLNNKAFYNFKTAVIDVLASCRLLIGH